MRIVAKGHTTSYRHAGTTLRRTSSDVIIGVNGLSVAVVAYKHALIANASCMFSIKNKSLGFALFLMTCISLTPARTLGLGSTV